MLDKVFPQFSNIIAGTTTALFGDCSKHSPRTPDRQLVAHQQLCELVHCPKLITPNSLHTNICLHYPDDDLSAPADALITQEKNVLIAVPTADCIPVFIYDPNTMSIAIIHSGRKGLRDQITTNTISKMADQFHTKKKDLHIHIGVHICGECYEVGEEILSEYPNFQAQKKGHLSMKEVLIQDLRNFGIKQEQITDSKECTHHSLNTNDELKYFSYRNQQDPRRILSFIALK